MRIEYGKNELVNYLGLFSCFLYLVLIFIFSQERLYGDSGCYLFQLVNNTSFHYEHHRPISAVIQLIPYLQVKYHVSLAYIIPSFSINEWLYYLVCFIILAFLLKDSFAAVGMCFTLFLGSRWNFFNPVSELLLASPLIFILYSILKRQSRSLWQWLVIFILDVILIYSHPFYSLFVPLILVVHYYFFRPSLSKSWIVIYVFTLLLIIFHFFSIDHYDNESLAGNEHSFHDRIDFLMHFNYAAYFSKMGAFYGGTLILLAWSFIYFWKTQRKTFALLSVLICVGIAAIVLFEYGNYFPDRFEPFERYHFIIPMFVALLFFNHVIDNIFKPYSLLILAAVLLYHSVLILNYGLVVKTRYNIVHHAIDYAQQFPEQKTAFRAANFFVKRIGHVWTLPTEATLLSAQYYSNLSRQIYVKEAIDSQAAKNVHDPNTFFFAPWWLKNFSELNTEYFQITNGNVREANTDTIQSDYPQSFFEKIKLEIGGKRTLYRNKEYLLPITVINHNPLRLASGNKMESIYLSYHWQNDKGYEVWDGLRSPFFADVYTTLQQDLLIKAPVKKGTYSLIVDILFEGKRWAQVPFKEVEFRII